MPRKNGCSPPFHIAQIMSFIAFCFTFAAYITSIVVTYKSSLAKGMYILFYIVIFGAVSTIDFIASHIDPTDPLVLQVIEGRKE